MKARVKYNNEIIDVIQVGTKTHLYDLNNVEFLDNPQDYWTKLEHRYAGMVMQGMLSSGDWVKLMYRAVSNDEQFCDLLTYRAQELAHILVEKLKEEEKK